jgi:hypothetical protein
MIQEEQSNIAGECWALYLENRTKRHGRVKV